MNKHEIKEILEKHKQWRSSNGKLGERADLTSANLRYADLRYASLRGANLRYANLTDADLRHADLRDADLRYANLADADLTDANLTDAKLIYADLPDADLGYADLRGAVLTGADLAGANLTGVKVNSLTEGYLLTCPEKGSFIGFKKCENNTIVELLIPADAKRSSATTRKCRANKAVVLDIIDEDGEQIETTASNYDSDFIYKVGETVEVKDFDEDRWEECSTGIHFFITRREAEEY